MNLLEYFEKNNYPKNSLESDIVPDYLSTTVCDSSKDRFKGFVVVFHEEPTKLYVVKYKSSNSVIESHETVLRNHNGLQTDFKAGYEAFLKELDDVGVIYELNNEDF